MTSKSFIVMPLIWIELIDWVSNCIIKLWLDKIQLVNLLWNNYIKLEDLLYYYSSIGVLIKFNDSRKVSMIIINSETNYDVWWQQYNFFQTSVSMMLELIGNKYELIQVMTSNWTEYYCNDLKMWFYWQTRNPDKYSNISQSDYLKTISFANISIKL